MDIVVTIQDRRSDAITVLWLPTDSGTMPRGLYVQERHGPPRHVWPSPMSMVEEFHRVYEVPIAHSPGMTTRERSELRGGFLFEEADEAQAAVEENDLVGLADALADEVYFCYGWALEAGIPLDLVLAGCVQPSNMSKLGTDGRPIKREDGKVMKGPNFFKPEPRIHDLLVAQGWTPPTK